MPQLIFTLFSGLTSLVEICGPIVYTTKAGVPIDPNVFPIVYTIPPKTTQGELVFLINEGFANNTSGAFISVEVNDENLPDKKSVPTSPYETEYTLWTSAYFEYYQIYNFKYADIKFKIRDYCFGMTYGEEYYKISQIDTVVKSQTNIVPPDIKITKYALSDPTTLALSRLIYYQYKKFVSDPDVSTGCGTLSYSIDVPS